MRRLARGYSIHLRSRAALIRRNDDFGIGMRWAADERRLADACGTVLTFGRDFVGQTWSLAL